MLAHFSLARSPTFLMCVGQIFFLLLLRSCVTVEADIYIFDDKMMKYFIDEFDDKELSFSVPVDKQGLKGAIVNADPADACTSICGPPDTNYSLAWFVLIAGNFCDYNTKVVNAKRSGYSAAVIYNIDERKATLKQDYADISNISAVSIMASSGIIIKENYLFTIDSRFIVLIYPNGKYHVAIYLLLFFVSGCIVSALAIVILKFIGSALRTRRYLNQQYNLNNYLPISSYGIGDQCETCVICLEDFKLKDKLRILPCSHGFHTKCIDPWLTRSNRVCPICKQKLALGSYSNVQSSETAPLIFSSTTSHSSYTYTSISSSM